MKIVFFEIKINRHTAILCIYGSHEQKKKFVVLIKKDDWNAIHNVRRI